MPGSAGNPPRPILCFRIHRGKPRCSRLCRGGWRRAAAYIGQYDRMDERAGLHQAIRDDCGEQFGKQFNGVADQGRPGFGLPKGQGRAGMDVPSGPVPPLAFAAPSSTEDDIEAVVAVLRSGWLTSGTQVQALLDLPPGSRVGAPTWTHVASVLGFSHHNVVPGLNDIDGDSLNLSPSALETAIAVGLDAVVAVHYWGRTDRPRHPRAPSRGARQRGRLLLLLREQEPHLRRRWGAGDPRPCCRRLCPRLLTAWTDCRPRRARLRLRHSWRTSARLALIPPHLGDNFDTKVVAGMLDGPGALWHHDAVADQLATRVRSLPLHARMSRDEVMWLLDALTESVRA